MELNLLTKKELLAVCVTIGLTQRKHYKKDSLIQLIESTISNRKGYQILSSENIEETQKPWDIDKIKFEQYGR